MSFTFHGLCQDVRCFRMSANRDVYDTSWIFIVACKVCTLRKKSCELEPFCPVFGTLEKRVPKKILNVKSFYNEPLKVPKWLFKVI